MLYTCTRTYKMVLDAGRTDDIRESALAHSKGGAGFITKINSDLDACFVKWDLVDEECGWYRCGAYG
jgi:hypothetical protein